MDAFEQIVEGLFRHKGFWTQIGYKIDVLPEEKRAIGKPSMPRPEIDILAYKPVTNDLWWIECKSYMDSYGVSYQSFKPNGKGAERYKIFTNDRYREIVSQALLRQVTDVERPLVLPHPRLHFCLVAGKVRENEREDLRNHFKNRDWTLIDERMLKQELTELSGSGYENNIAVMVAKLLNRG
jgi:hypothetical protein